MKQTITYLGVEKIKYTFDEYDIKRALCKLEKIKEYDPKRRLEFVIYEADNGTHLAEITLRFETEVDKPEGDAGNE